MKRVGAALREALSKDSKREHQTSRSGAWAMGENEARVLSYVSHHPCSIKSHIAAALGISQASVDWHIRKLVKNDLVSVRRAESRQSYAPVGMLRDEELRLFSLLANEFARQVFHELASREGAAQEELAKVLGVSRQSLGRFLRDLQGAGAVHAIKDGRNVRYYPSDLMSGGADVYLDRRRTFLEGVLSRLTALGFKHKVVKNDPSEVHILVGPPGKQVAVRLGLNPYVTALWLDKNM